MMDRLILVGRVAGAFGVRGEIKITTYTDEPASLLRYRALKTEAGALALTLTSGRAHKGQLVARANEVATRDEAEALRGLALYAPRSAFPAPDEDEFYLADLIGLTVVTPEGAELGVVKSAQNFGAGDLLEIAPPGAATWYLPFTKDAVPEVRIADGLIVAVRPTETE
ncbi:MAG TPA: ribosome maturation factor RimM [Caulobacteraceae bacterium]|nr:ribosome maturation factor RimM [Caulobacteraceae bacterium]